MAYIRGVYTELMTRLIQTYDKHGNKMGFEPAECGVVRPETLGYQQCTRTEGHRGKHRSQDGHTFMARRPNAEEQA